MDNFIEQKFLEHWAIIICVGTGVIAFIFGWFSVFLTILLFIASTIQDTVRWKNTNIQLFL